MLYYNIEVLIFHFVRKSYSRTSRTVTVSSSLSLSHCALPFLLSTGWGRCTPSLLKKTIALTMWKDILKTTLSQLGEISAGRVGNIFISFDYCKQCWDKGTQRCCFCKMDSLVRWPLLWKVDTPVRHFF